MDDVDERTRTMIDAIASSGAAVYGELDDLIVPAAPGGQGEISEVPVDVAIQMLMGLATMAAKDAKG